MADQDLHPEMDVQLRIEKQASPRDVTEGNRKFQVRVEDGKKKQILEQLTGCGRLVR